MLSPDETLVFALDADTRELRHVREGRTGRHCNRICPGCGQRLEAVNAQSPAFKRRPHFRHLEGQNRRQCAASAVKAAVVQALASPGYILRPTVLPGPTLFAGGEAIVEPLEIESASIDDFTEALLRLPDGRELRIQVEFRDTRGVEEDGKFDLVLFLPPRALDSLQSLEDLRRYLTLDRSAWRWCSRQTQPSLTGDPRAIGAEAAAQAIPQSAQDLRLRDTFQDFRPSNKVDLPIPSGTRREPRKLPEVRMNNPDGSVTVFHRWRLPSGQMSEEVEIVWPR